MFSRSLATGTPAAHASFAIDELYLSMQHATSLVHKYPVTFRDCPVQTIG